MKKINKQQKQMVVFVILLIVVVIYGYKTFFSADSYVENQPEIRTPQMEPAISHSQVNTNVPIKQKEFNVDLTSLLNELVYNSPNQKEGFLSIVTKESARLAELAAAVAQQQAIAAKAQYEKEKSDYELERMREQRAREKAERERVSNVQRRSPAQALPTANIDYNQLVGGVQPVSPSVMQVKEIVPPPKKPVEWDSSQFEVRGIVNTDDGLMAMVFYKSVRQNLVKGSRFQNGEIIVKDIQIGEIVLDVDGESRVVYFNM